MSQIEYKELAIHQHDITSSMVKQFQVMLIKYVNEEKAFSPRKEHTSQTHLLDMLYFLGVAINPDEFKNADGFRKFSKLLVQTLMYALQPATEKHQPSTPKQNPLQAFISSLVSDPIGAVTAGEMTLSNAGSCYTLKNAEGEAMSMNERKAELMLRELFENHF